MAQVSPAETLGAAEAKLRAGDAVRARADCKRLLAKTPSLAPAQFLLAAIEAQLGNFESAFKASRRATQLEPANARFRFQYAQIARNLGDIKGAIKSLTEAVAAIPDDMPLHHLLGMLLFEARKFEDAQAVYRRALEKWPASAPMLAQISWAEAELGAWTDAVEHASRAIAANANLPSAQHAFGDAVVMFGRHEEAIRAYETCLSLSGTSPAVAKNVTEMRDDAILLKALIPDVRAAFSGAQGAIPELGTELRTWMAAAVTDIHAQLSCAVTAPFTVVFFHVDVGDKHPFRAGGPIDYSELLRLASGAVQRAVPGAGIVVITDAHSDLSAVAGLGTVVRLKINPDWLMYARMCANYALTASKRVASPVAFLDTDISLNRNFAELVDGGFDVGLTYRHGAGFPHMPVNEGVILGARGDSVALESYFQKCLTYYEFMVPLLSVKKRYPFDIRRWRGGQLSIAAFVDWKTPPFAARDEVRHGIRCRFLPGNTYNYAAGPFDDMDTLGDKWAVHFKGVQAKKLMAQFVAHRR